MKNVVICLISIAFIMTLSYAISESLYSDSSTTFSVRNGITFDLSAQEICDIEKANGVDAYLFSFEGKALRVACSPASVEGLESYVGYEFDPGTKHLVEINYAIDDAKAISDPSISIQQMDYLLDIYSIRYGKPAYSNSGLDYKYPTAELKDFCESTEFSILDSYEWIVPYERYDIVIDMFRMKYIKDGTYSLLISINEITNTKMNENEEMKASPSVFTTTPIYEHAQVLSIPTGGEYSLIYLPKADVTMDALIDWFYNYVQINNYKWCMILYSDSSKNEGVYANAGFVEVGDIFEKDSKSWGVCDSSHAKIYLAIDGSLKMIE